MTVHQTVEADSKKRLYIAKCGQTRPFDKGYPSDYSVWHSAVTCPECLGLKFPQSPGGLITP